MTGVVTPALSAAALGLLLTACTPFPVVQRVAASRPGCLFFARTMEKVVALTLDDGPDRTTTPRILDLLRKHDARATFFLISSRVQGKDPVVLRIVKEGHEIGNHMTRDEASIRLSRHKFEKLLLEADSVLRRFAAPRWMRPASGWYNAEMIATVRRHNYRCALGSVYPFDPAIPIPGWASRVILGQVQPGAIIILHDGGQRGRNTYRVLERVLPELARRGYRIVTLSELMAIEGSHPRTVPRRRQIAG